MVYPDLERNIYNNEIFSLLGFFIFSLLFLSRNFPLGYLRPLYTFIAYGVVIFIISLPSILQSGLYLSARTLTIWYSVFGFFLGFMFVQVIGLKRFSNIVVRFSKVSWVLMFVTWYRLTPQVLFSFGRKSTAQSYFLFLCVMISFFVMKSGATTVTAIIFATVVYVWVNSKTFSVLLGRKTILVFSIVLLLSIYFFIPVFNKFLQVGYEGFSGDNNATWRLMFWVYLFKEKFLNSPLLGIGFGTPLFDLVYAPEFLTSDDGSRNTEYTLGTHNSFFYAAIRLGLIGFVLLILSILRIYAVAVKAYRMSGCDKEKNLMFSLILANIMFLNSALFNVILESPLYAANFWVTLGLMYGVAMKVIRGAT